RERGRGLFARPRAFGQLERSDSRGCAPIDARFRASRGARERLRGGHGALPGRRRLARCLAGGAPALGARTAQLRAVRPRSRGRLCNCRSCGRLGGHIRLCASQAPSRKLLRSPDSKTLLVSEARVLRIGRPTLVVLAAATLIAAAATAAVVVVVSHGSSGSG